MYIEYCLYDRTLSEKDISKEIEKALDMGVKNFCLLPYSLASLKNSGLLKEINVSVPLDYPFGIMDIDARKAVLSNLLNVINFSFTEKEIYFDFCILLTI